MRLSKIKKEINTNCACKFCQCSNCFSVLTEGEHFLVKVIINRISETSFNFLLKSFFMFACVNITGLHTSPSHNTATFNMSKSRSSSFSLFWTTLISYERLIWINWQMCRVPLLSGSCLWAFLSKAATAIMNGLLLIRRAFNVTSLWHFFNLDFKCFSKVFRHILFSVNSLNQLNSSCFRREVPKTQAQVFGKPSFFMTFRIFPPICLLPIHRKTEG